MKLKKFLALTAAVVMTMSMAVGCGSDDSNGNGGSNDAENKTTEFDASYEISVVSREEGSGTRKEAEKQLRGAKIDPTRLDVIASIANQETIKKSVRQGLGISIISKLAAEDETEAGFVLSFPIPGADSGRDINLVYNKNYQLSRAAERFIKVVKEVYKTGK